MVDKFVFTREQAEHRQEIAVCGAQIGSARLAAVATATTEGWPMLDVFAVTRSHVAVYPLPNFPVPGRRDYCGHEVGEL